MSDTIRPGDLWICDPGDKRHITFDYDTNTGLATGVLIATSTFTITAIKQNGVGALTQTSSAILTGSRKTRVYLDATASTVGDRYYLMNEIVTDESPTQTIQRQIVVLVQNQ